MICVVSFLINIVLTALMRLLVRFNSEIDYLQVLVLSFSFSFSSSFSFSKGVFCVFLWGYIYIYIYVCCHTQTDCFVVPQLSSVSRHTRCFKRRSTLS